MLRSLWPLGVGLLTLSTLQLACTHEGSDSPLAGPNLMTVYGCEITPSCSGGEGGGTQDPDTAAPGYWMGTTITPQTCFSPTGVGINDTDLDGLSDYCEWTLAERFRPSRVMSSHEPFPGSEPYWAAKYFPDHGGAVRIIYAFAYYHDGGAPSTTWPAGVACNLGSAAGSVVNVASFVAGWPAWYAVIISIAGGVAAYVFSPEHLCETHRGDSEFVTLDLRYNTETQHWYVISAFFAAHYGTSSDRSQWVPTHGMEYPERYGGYPRVWVAESKHGSFQTRGVCTGGLGDTCNSNSLLTEERVRWSKFYNLGSAQGPMVNCVSGGTLVAIYPELYSQECFWNANTRFEGWQPYRLNTASGTSTAYAWVLMTAFECYSWVAEYTVCTDKGVDRSVPQP